MDCKQEKFIALAREIYVKGKKKGMTWNDAQKEASRRQKSGDTASYLKYKKYWLKKTSIYGDNKLTAEQKKFLRDNKHFKKRLMAEYGDHYGKFKYMAKQRKSGTLNV